MERNVYYKFIRKLRYTLVLRYVIFRAKFFVANKSPKTLKKRFRIKSVIIVVW